ncbi:MAG: 7-carboxy-7-deazaguanine synthase QueE [Planctomycetota bacterium]
MIEVFASIQGEGKYVGQPQVFLRLAGCPLRCRYCDTPGSWRIREGAQVRIDAPNGVRRENAWATPLEALQWIGAVEPGNPGPSSITGGEPLLAGLHPRPGVDGG